MVLQSNGTISFNDIQTEFGGVNPIYFDEYYNNAITGYTAGIIGIPNIGSQISLKDFYGKSKGPPTPVQTTFYGTYAWVGGRNTSSEWVNGCSGSNLTRSNVSTFNNRYSQGAGRPGALYYPDLILQARAGDTIRFIVSMSNGINADHEYIRAWINLGGGYYQIGNTLDTYGGNTLTVDYTIPVGTPAGNYALCGMNDYAYYDSYYRSVNYYSLHIW